MKNYIYILFILSNIFAYAQVDPDCCFDDLSQASAFLAQEDPINVALSTENITMVTTVTPLVIDLDNNGILDPEIITVGVDATGNYVNPNYPLTKIIITPNNYPSAPIREIPLGMNFGNFFSLAAGDVIPTLPGNELVVVDSNGNVNILHSFGNINSPSSSPVFSSTNTIMIGTVSSENRNPLIADINEDGKVEVYLGNNVFYHTGTGVLGTDWAKATTLATNNASREYQINQSTGGTLSTGYTNPFLSTDRKNRFQNPIAVDIMSSNPGKELILGNEIYRFTGSALTLIYDANNILNLNTSAIEQLEDGFVSVGDTDGDGFLDVVVNGTIQRNNKTYFGLYIYDPENNNFKAFINSTAQNPTGVLFSGKSVTLAELDQSIPGAEIIWLETNKISVHNITLPATQNYSYWTITNASGTKQDNLPIVDVSGSTGVSAFDFNSDGSAEIVYRDQESFRIIYGGNDPAILNPGTNLPGSILNDRNWYPTAANPGVISGSGTGVEYPIIADYDLDGEAEIITVSSNTRASNFGNIKIYESAGIPWSPTVPYWNQYQYYHVNVTTPPLNAPLTSPHLQIPSTQTSQLLNISGQTPYNIFLGQPSLVRDSIQYYPDLNIKVISSNCEEIKIEICNSCPDTAPANTPLRAFDQDPTTSNAGVRGVYSTPSPIAEGQCITMSIPINNTQGDWFFVVNDTGSTAAPYTLSPSNNYSNFAYKECEYDDNIANVNVICPPPPGEFPECCENPIEIERTNEGSIVNAPNGVYNSDPFSLVQDEFTIQSNSLIPITEFRAVVTDLDFEYNYETCATCINNPALWGSLGGSLYVGNTLTNTDIGTNILADRINRREVIWEEPRGAMLVTGDKFTLDYAFSAVSEIPCCVTSVTVCIEISYKDANCVVCTFPICRSIELKEVPKPVTALKIEVSNDGCCSKTLTADADTAADFQWSTNEKTKSITVSKNGTYTVTATSGGVTKTQTIVVNDIMSGSFPLLSFNSLFHPDFVPPYKNKFYIMDVSAGKVIEGVPNSYNATAYKLEIYHRWNTQGGQGQPLKTITGISDSCNGFDNWAIKWDGTDQNGNSLKDDRGDSYVWHLTLKNCDNESSKLTYKTTWVPVCEEPRYLFPRWKKIRIGCKKWSGYWKTEMFSFGDVQMHR